MSRGVFVCACVVMLNAIASHYSTCPVDALAFKIHSFLAVDIDVPTCRFQKDIHYNHNDYIRPIILYPFVDFTRQTKHNLFVFTFIYLYKTITITKLQVDPKKKHGI